MEFKWKLYWIVVGVLLILNGLTCVFIPFNRKSVQGVFMGIPHEYSIQQKTTLPIDYVLYYVNGQAFTCSRGLYFPYNAGDNTPIIYNSKKPWISYNYTFLNFWILVSIPFLFVHFIWFAFILRVYDPLMEPIFPRVKKTINIDAYQRGPKMMKNRQLPRQRRD